MGTVIVIPADDSEEIRFWEADEQPALQDLQDMVGGYIEAVPHWNDYMGEPCVAWCNEEGKISDPPLPVNQRATQIWWQKLEPGGPFRRDLLVGDIVLVIGLPDEEEDEE